MSDLEEKVTNPVIKGQKFIFGSKVYIFKQADNFEYCDPIDKSVTTKQVINPIKLFIMWQSQNKILKFIGVFF